VHCPSASPVVLFLHSIMGVGTNLFPMQLEQRPTLAALVTASELRHIECFPTVLRLLQIDLLPELLALSPARLAQVSGLTCHRLLGPEMSACLQAHARARTRSHAHTLARARTPLAPLCNEGQFVCARVCVCACAGVCV
jgi:hypothetical protein